jgi:hypothetical protein
MAKYLSQKYFVHYRSYTAYRIASMYLKYETVLRDMLISILNIIYNNNIRGIRNLAVLHTQWIRSSKNVPTFNLNWNMLS